MRRAGLLLAVGVVGIMAIIGMGAVAPVPSSESSEIAEIKRAVADLRQRVESLEQQVKKGFVPVPFGAGKPLPGVIVPPYGRGQVQPNWTPFEFNGMTYYFVPIDQAHAGVSEAARQVPPEKTPATPPAAGNVPKP